MPKKMQKFFKRAGVIRIEEPDAYGNVKIHVWTVYGGGNQLKFRCPFCGLVEAHGAGAYADAPNGTPSPHCDCRSYPPYEKRILWVMHEISEGMDVSWAGDLEKENRTVCPRRIGKPGYDQLEKGQINYSAKPYVLIRK